MTVEEAVKYLERLVISEVWSMAKTDKMSAITLQVAWNTLKDACKAENRLNDEGTTTKGMDIPESPKHEELDGFRNNVDLSLNELNDRLSRLEHRFDIISGTVTNNTDCISMIIKKVVEGKW